MTDFEMDALRADRDRWRDVAIACERAERLAQEQVRVLTEVARAVCDQAHEHGANDLVRSDLIAALRAVLDDDPDIPAGSIEVGDTFELTATGELRGEREITIREVRAVPSEETPQP